MLTEIGKELRKLRIDNGERLLEMSRRIGKSSSFISAVEVGKKSPPAGFEDLVIEVYGLAAAAARCLRRAADRSRAAFVVEPDTILGRDTAGLFARRVNTLSHDQLEEINSILRRGDDEWT
jgi:transcriptional regulator with XRE-family HTH domain